MNENWVDLPDSAGIWWAVNQNFPGTWMVAKVDYEGGRQQPKLLISMAGDRRSYHLMHFYGVLLWQKASYPIYHWSPKEVTDHERRTP